MKILYIGGQKSGKSFLAEQKALKLSVKKPYYIATYDNSYQDKEMISRIKEHQKRRNEKFITIEESINLHKVITENKTYIIDCLSMWIFNTLEKEIDHFQIIDKVLSIDANIVFVLNDVGSTIIPANTLSRRYIDANGIIGQRVASNCNEVYQVVAGLEKQLK